MGVFVFTILCFLTNVTSNIAVFQPATEEIKSDFQIAIYDFRELVNNETECLIFSTRFFEFLDENPSLTCSDEKTSDSSPGTHGNSSKTSQEKECIELLTIAHDKLYDNCDGEFVLGFINELLGYDRLISRYTVKELLKTYSDFGINLSLWGLAALLDDKAKEEVAIYYFDSNLENLMDIIEYYNDFGPFVVDKYCNYNANDMLDKFLPSFESDSAKIKPHIFTNMKKHEEIFEANPVEEMIFKLRSLNICPTWQLGFLEILLKRLDHSCYQFLRKYLTVFIMDSSREGDKFVIEYLKPRMGEFLTKMYTSKESDEDQQGMLTTNLETISRVMLEELDSTKAK
eukprot:NODE_521_length_7287_cov_0.275042.p2 type:complete len:343 gc:universal NODE_521_length_7287_cov_0.275042:1650-2678(+)